MRRPSREKLLIGTSMDKAQLTGAGSLGGDQRPRALLSSSLRGHNRPVKPDTRSSRRIPGTGTRYRLILVGKLALPVAASVPI